MEKRTIKIEFDDSDYGYNEGVDVLLKVSSTKNKKDYILLSTYSYSNDDYCDSSVGTEECLEQFREALDNENIDYNDEDFEYGSDNYDLIEEKFEEIFEEDDYDDYHSRSYFDKESVIALIKNNKCSWATFVIDTCFEKILQGQTRLVPGSDRIPKNMSFADVDNNKYYAKIDSIELIKKKEQSKLSNIEIPFSTCICVAFEHPNCDYILLFNLGYMNDSIEDRNIRFYKKKGSIKTIEHSSESKSIILYDLGKCTVDIKSSSTFTENIGPMLNYYSLKMNDLNDTLDQVRIEVDLDFLHESYTLFANLIPDEDLITLPVKGNGQRIKSISLIAETYSGDVNKYDFFEANISTFSKEDIEVHTQTLLENGMDLPKGRSLVLLDVIDLYDKDKFLFRKLLNDGDLKKCIIVNNIEGERTRLKRIVSGIENSLSGRVVNKTLVETICKNNVKDSIPEMLKNHSYVRNDEYIEYLKKEYYVLSGNNEQLEAIDKIMQMSKNDVDVMVIQGPPGTGKTELILSLAKELTKKKQKTLITSNVHVACDNVVERLKNNKDIVLKRYTTIKGDQYEKELIENQKRYVENQILAGFKYEDNVISSIEVYDNLCKQRDELLEKKEKILKSKEDYEFKLSPYNSAKSRKEELIELIDLNSNKIEELRLSIQENEDIISTTETAYNKCAKNIDDLRNEKEKLKFSLSQEQGKMEILKQELSNLYNDNDLFENKIEEDKRLIKKASNQNDDANKQLSEKKSFLTFLDSTSIDNLKKDVLSYAFKKSELSEYEIVLVKNCLDEVEFLVDVVNKIEKDKDFWDNGYDFSLTTLEYVIFTVSKSKYALDCLKKETIDVLDDIYTYYKLGNGKKKMMSVFSFVKTNSHNNDYFKNCINRLNKDLKELQFNNQNLILNTVEKTITESQLTKIIDDIKKEVDNLEDTISKNDLLIDNCKKEMYELEAKIDFNKTTISNKTKDVFECQNLIDSLTERVEKGIEDEIIVNNDDLLKQKKILDEYNTDRNQNLSQKEEIERDNEKLNKELLEVIDNIKKYEVELADFIDGYDSFVDRFNIDFLDITKKIDKFNATFNGINSRFETMIKNGWNKEEALDFVFSYVSELENIIESDSKAITNYFNGRGSIFNNMFLLSEDNEESLISMTTSQVASLLNSTDSDELTFDYAIVDEASKCKFEDIIISLPRVKHLVLIGDFMQLDPMYDDYKNIDLRFQSLVSSEQWEVMNRSSFSMILSQFVEYNEKHKISEFSANPSVAVMKRQYRMNKGIFNIIKPIYSIHKGFELIDEKKMTSNDIKCVEIKGSEIEHGTSFYNVEEGDAIVSVLNSIKDNKDKYPKIKSIGIITGYRAQQNYLVRKLKNFKIAGVQVQIGTFDRFQGREYDLVIVSLVRTVKLGFTNNIRRMNVAFSRAKNHLLVLGDFTSLLNIAKKISKSSREEYSSSDAKENDFVAKTLIPKLYDLKEDFVSTDEFIKNVNDFLKEVDYE